MRFLALLCCTVASFLVPCDVCHFMIGVLLGRAHGVLLPAYRVRYVLRRRCVRHLHTGRHACHRRQPGRVRRARTLAGLLLRRCADAEVVGLVLNERPGGVELGAADHRYERNDGQVAGKGHRPASRPGVRRQPSPPMPSRECHPCLGQASYFSIRGCK
ncbi:hypothetical protein DF3PA_180063 [Candidatus Defluviicoccus seviourii]|uniref:Uncharacterized protein n=1 Tax=Candidatus Defluviicoccus seviourii TaxID=2565273 RepID=A0A564WEP5_9PROT|nr:hypothetical protein DF3PA_180063 [Candidatus Defluviicoccus seviourii]